jgi:hypothetical protein
LLADQQGMRFKVLQAQALSLHSGWSGGATATIGLLRKGRNSSPMSWGTMDMMIRSSRLSDRRLIAWARLTTVRSG